MKIEGLTNNGKIIYYNLIELVNDDIDFLRSLLTSVYNDFELCKRSKIIPHRTDISRWVTYDNKIFTITEKEIFKQFINEYGILPLSDAVVKIYNETSALNLIDEIDSFVVEEINEEDG